VIEFEHDRVGLAAVDARKAGDELRLPRTIAGPIALLVRTVAFEVTRLVGAVMFAAFRGNA